MGFSKATSFAVKDPGQNLKLKAIVGEEQPSYNSFIKVHAFKTASLASFGTNIFIQGRKPS